jgi:hypothetical protein
MRGIKRRWFDVPLTVFTKARKGRAMTENLVLDTTPLNALDRCDRCGAQAYVRAVMANGFELLFCGHHAKKYQEGLANVATRIQDETERITEESTAK